MNFDYTHINEIFRLFTILCLALFVQSTKWSGDSKPLHNKHVVCYVATWSVYRPGRGSFKIENINGNLCTHVVYAFVGLNATTNTVRSIDPYYDLEENYGKGSFKKMTQLKAKYPHLKVTLAVGGWNEGSLNYSTMALNPDSRKTFIKSAMEYVTKYNFDGFDVDWEFPTSRQGRPEDKQNFVLLLKELKEELAPKNLILTVALGASKSIIDAGYDIPEISKYADLLHIMCYDYHGSWDTTIGPNAPLRSGDGLDLETSIKHIINIGAPPKKLVIGIPAYGHTFQIENATNVGFGSSFIAPGPKGIFTQQEGFQGYNEICAEFMKFKNWSKFWDEESVTPFATNGNIIVSYDDESSIQEKVYLGLRYDVGGFMIWSIDTDDFHGDCVKTESKDQEPAHSHNYPLLRAIHNSINVYSLSVNEEGIDDLDTNNIDGLNINDLKGDRSWAPAFLPLSLFSVILMSFVCI